MATTTSNHFSGQLDLNALKGCIPLIGLTGGIGSGKTAVSDLLGTLGAGIVDTDVIAHQITAPHGLAIEAIAEQFGPDYLDAKGALDRVKMRDLVFNKPEAKKALEAITHPLIRQATIKQAELLAKNGAPYLVFVVPLLIESGSWLNLLDEVVVVDCPKEVQISRVMHRSNLSRLEVEKILATQTSREERLAHANIVIENQGSFHQLEAKVEQLHQKILGIKKDKFSSS
jgi:dephospho-CoA kinase